ncbi:MAG: DegT/DnrJ/EryC1/StrS family aminotransferase, partial [Candidatus Omnitrophica bacterium]|nr:DegT/DnrJ/EryC1/StrS family aminotransferase [Candidatus Omnitrophota bacterium]
GDEVITTPVTFIATTEAITRVGATPVFVDIDPDDYCMDVNQVEARITERTKAILPVHLFGHPADMDGLRALCNKHSLLMVEDCAQAIGATWKGEPAGSLSEAGTFSFFPSKNLGGYGDGGMVVTSDEDLADHLRFLRVHGSPDKTRYTMEGQNSRLDELQAAMLRVKLAHLETWNALRREHALYYCRGFAYLAREGRIELPTEKPGAKSVYHLFIVRVDDRDGLHAHLNARGISSAVYYRIPMHLQPVYETLGFPAGSFPQAERVCSRFLALPLYPELTTEQLDRVLGAVSEFLSA